MATAINRRLVLILVGAAFVVLIAYLTTTRTRAGGDVVMPLDDVYIHFQYARQIAQGEFYVYNSGDDPTSGATSFIYPYVLAAGYLFGFQGLNLGLWAMLIGAVGLASSMGFIVLLARHADLPIWAGSLGAILFAFNGPIAWHYMSGMETGLVITLTLATLTAFVSRRYRAFIVAASLLALSRPEAGIMAGIAIVLMAVHLLRSGASWGRLRGLALPLIAIAVQPLLNWAITGSFSASGSQAKSILGMIPFEWSVVIDRILDNFLRMWGDLATGTGGDFAPIILAPLALIGWLGLLARKQAPNALLILGWFIAVTAAVSTLDTAFWHFKRYQMPLIALLYPLALWGVGWLWQIIDRRNGIAYARWPRYGLAALILWMIIATGGLWREFLRLYDVNVRNVISQPLPMAEWLRAGTPDDAVIAVHDVGMMRYIGQRETLDMVGLTTPAAADYWRSGPGSVAEFLIQRRPDYVAAYTTARGLNYLEATSIYGDLLQGFTATYDPADNVALGAEFQGIYATDFRHVQDAYPTQGSLAPLIIHRGAGAAFVVDAVDVADLDSEEAHDYIWQGDATGFVTEAYEFDYLSCPDDHQQGQNETVSCAAIDGGRRITDYEQFMLTLEPGRDTMLVTRLHPRWRGTLDIYANGTLIDTQWIPEIPGHWLEIPTFIPGEQITRRTSVRIVPTLEPDAAYMPYHHWALQGLASTFRPWMEDTPAASWQDSSIMLMRQNWHVNGNRLEVDLLWQTDGSARGDYVFFVHVYDSLDAPPVAQSDRYPLDGTLPPGNWPPGVISDEFMVDLSQLSPGNYRIAIGFYNPTTGERLQPTTDIYAVEDNRLFIGDLTVDG